MKKNIGITDRIIRFVAIDLLMGFSLSGLEVSAVYTNAAFLLSIGLALTILTAYSPIYHLLGIKTTEEKNIA